MKLLKYNSRVGENFLKMTSNVETIKERHKRKPERNFLYKIIKCLSGEKIKSMTK